MKDFLDANVAPGFVELQLLRHGPAHNQLLSPLTEYLALCGDHPNTTLNIPLEHSALETRLRALRYRDSEETRFDQLRETARIASELLAKVPGLIADLASTRSDGKPYVHLSIASRASELALFPFELALSPDGFPGAGQPLCMQKQLPVCLTRRSRNVRNNYFPWHRDVKILFIASAAGGAIPYDQHYSLLRKLADPWIAVREWQSDEVKRKWRRRTLRVLVNADVDSIERTLCDEVDATGVPFSHIHVLAHGCDLPETDRRSGVALNRPHGRPGIDAVDGRRLAAALGCLPDYPSSSRRQRGPTAVTLATCSSSDQGGVIVPGASLAFELHDSGIPLVIGSQFPLTADGSVVMTESLYRGFLSGRDPRSTIWETRRALATLSPESPARSGNVFRAAHDWASLTAYAALPADLDTVMPEHRCARQSRRMDRNLANSHELLKRVDSHRLLIHTEEIRRKPKNQIDSSSLSPTAAAAAATDRRAEYQAEIDRLTHFLSPTMRATDAAVRKVEKWVNKFERGEKDSEVINLGILASAQKQVALLLLRLAGGEFGTIADTAAQSSGSEAATNPAGGPVTYSSDEITEWSKRGEELLRKARDTYWTIFQLSRDESWALVQWLSLVYATGEPIDWELWSTAFRLSQLDEHSRDIQRRIWSLSALIELQFIDWLLDPKDETEDRVDPWKLARQLHDLYPEWRREVYSVKRQLQRYVDNFNGLANSCRNSAGVWDFERRKLQRMENANVQHFDPGIAKIREVLRIFEDIDYEG